MATGDSDPLQPSIFISYSHKDEEWKDTLLIQLSVLQGEDAFVAWDDRRIGAGENWRPEIERAMDAARVAVLLVTANFLTSKFILAEEVPRLLARRQQGLRIVPVIAKPCPWQRIAWLAEIQVRPKDGRPLSVGNGAQIDTDCAAIADEIATILNTCSAPGLPAPPPSPSEAVPATDSAVDAEQTGAAVRTVTELVTHPQLAALIESFSSEFKSAAREIDAITLYKELHDELHTFENDTFADLLSEHARVADDARARGHVDAQAASLLATVNQARAFATQLANAKAELTWIDRLEQAHQLLKAALGRGSVAPAAAAVALLTRVLDTEPVRLNDEIVRRATALEFAPLEGALRTIRERIERKQFSPARQRQIADGIAALGRLQDDFRTLVDDHNAWQQIEQELRMLEASIAGSLGPLEFLWSILLAKTDPFCAASSAPWAAAITRSTASLQTSIDARDPLRTGETREMFRRFRRDCGQHFFYVDTQLLEACGQLGKVAESLQLLVRMIETTPP